MSYVEVTKLRLDEVCQRSIYNLTNSRADVYFTFVVAITAAYGSSEW